MTTDIRAESAALLAEALHASCETEWAIKATRGVTEMTLHFPDAHHDRAEAILAASPTLARRLAFATAWEMAEAECKRLGWSLKLRTNPFHDDRGYVSAQGIGPGRGRGRASLFESGYSHDDDPTDALLALAAKLREATR